MPFKAANEASTEKDKDSKQEMASWQKERIFMLKPRHAQRRGTAVLCSTSKDHINHGPHNSMLC